MIDKNSILNRLVEDAASLMEAKAEYIELVAEQFDEKGDKERAATWREDIPKINAAVELMRERAGSWA